MKVKLVFGPNDDEDDDDDGDDFPDDDDDDDWDECYFCMSWWQPL